MPKIPDERLDELSELYMHKSDQTIAEFAQSWGKESNQHISRSAMGRALLRYLPLHLTQELAVWGSVEPVR